MAWEYRYRDPTTDKRQSMFLNREKFPTQVAVERHLAAFVLKLNFKNPTLAILEPTFTAILDRFIEEEKLLEIKQRRPGDRCEKDLANAPENPRRFERRCYLGLFGVGLSPK
jgi:integrase